VVFVFVSVKHN